MSAHLVDLFTPLGGDLCAGGDQGLDDGKVVGLWLVAGRPERLPQDGSTIHVLLFEGNVVCQEHSDRCRMPAMCREVQPGLPASALRTRIDPLFQQELGDIGLTTPARVDERLLLLSFRLLRVFRKWDERGVRLQGCSFQNKTLYQIETSEGGGVRKAHAGAAPDKRLRRGGSLIPERTIESIRGGEVDLSSLRLHEEIYQRHCHSGFRRLSARKEKPNGIVRSRRRVTRALAEQKTGDVEDIRRDRASDRVACNVVEEGRACKIALGVPLTRAAVIAKERGVFVEQRFQSRQVACVERLDGVAKQQVVSEPRPTGEAVFMCKDELGIGQSNAAGGSRRCVFGVMLSKAVECGRLGGADLLQQLFRLGPVLIEIDALG